MTRKHIYSQLLTQVLYNKYILSKIKTNYIYLLDLGPIQNKSPKIQPEHARYHPYEKKEVKISPQKSLVNSKELNTQCTVSNTATESNAALMPIKKEFLMSPDNKIDSTQMLQRGTTNDS